MFEKNKLIHPERHKNKILHGNYARVDPHAEFTSAFINQAITQVDHYDNATPIPSEADVIQAKKWVDENEK